VEQESNSTKSIAHGFGERGGQHKEMNGIEKMIVSERRERRIYYLKY
jgi:hypothetical protein